MAIKYFKLLDMLNKKGLSKGEFKNMTDISSATLAKLSSHRPVNLAVIDSICRELKCQPGDIMEYVDEPQKMEEDAL